MEAILYVKPIQVDSNLKDLKYKILYYDSVIPTEYTNW